MITHDIDEAILLADRILLMTNGPFARVAESVEITIPRPRNRTEIVEHPNYYAIRNHLVQFLGKSVQRNWREPTDAPKATGPKPSASTTPSAG
jgi:nitrate/nitrite transport system ATP-binding protein